MIKLLNVTKTYDTGKNALTNVNLTINDGEFVFIVGPSGAGKTTLSKLLLKEIVPTKGKVLVNNIDITKLKRGNVAKYRRTLGVVFQDFRLIPTKTVYENVAFALQVTGQNSTYIQKKVPAILKAVNLLDKRNYYPSQISGGEQQRVALARAIVNDPKYIIADEPTGNIDPSLSYEIVQLLNEINKRGTTVIMVTHAHDLVTKFNHRVLILENGTITADYQPVKKQVAQVSGGMAYGSR